jgi:hypothetical protein
MYEIIVGFATLSLMKAEKSMTSRTIYNTSRKLDQKIVANKIE